MLQIVIYKKLNFCEEYTPLQLITLRHLASDANNGVHQLVLNLLRTAGVMAPNEVLTTHLTRVWKEYSYSRCLTRARSRPS